MEWFKKWIEHGLRHLTLSFIFTAVGVEAGISALATWLTRQIWASLGLAVLPAHFFVLLGILVFCAVTLFALFMVLLNRPVRGVLPDQEFSFIPAPPPPVEPTIVPLVLESPKTVDLRGQLQEIYFARFDDVMGICRGLRANRQPR